MEARPGILSSLGIRSSSTLWETWIMSKSWTSTAATMMGSISGLSRICMGDPIPSGQAALTRSKSPLISMVAESMLVSLLNSKMTTDEFSLETELICFMLLTVAMTCSRGLVTTISTSSGLAPG